MLLSDEKAPLPPPYTGPESSPEPTDQSSSAPHVDTSQPTYSEPRPQPTPISQPPQEAYTVASQFSGIQPQSIPQAQPSQEAHAMQPEYMGNQTQSFSQPPQQVYTSEPQPIYPTRQQSYSSQPQSFSQSPQQSYGNSQPQPVPQTQEAFGTQPQMTGTQPQMTGTQPQAVSQGASRQASMGGAYPQTPIHQGSIPGGYPQTPVHQGSISTPPQGMQEPQQAAGQPFGTQQYYTATPLAILGQGSAPVDCPACRHRAMTLTNTEVGNTTHAWALGFCLFFCLGCIPYLMTSTMNIRHNCGHCGALLATWHRSGHTVVHAHM